MFMIFTTEEEVPKGEKAFWVKVVLCSIVPVSLISAVGGLLGSVYVFNIYWVQNASQWVWFIAAGLWVTGWVTAIVAWILGNKQIALGMGLGLFIGLVFLAASCSANLFLSGF